MPKPPAQPHDEHQPRSWHRERTAGAPNRAQPRGSGMPKPPWLDAERVREALREARRMVREAVEGREGELADAVRELYAEIPRGSWLARGVARLLLGTVTRKGESTWVVYGVPSMSDWRNYYIVSLGPDGRYRCTCYSSSWGWYRAHRICTHIAAVMLARRAQRARQAAQSTDG